MVGQEYYYSDDGMTFFSSIGVASEMIGIDYMQNCGKYVMAGNSGKLYASEQVYSLIDSDLRSIDTAANIRGVAYGKGICIVTDANGRAFKSTDGVNWAEINSIPDNYSNRFNHLGYSRVLNKFCSANRNGIYTLDWDGNTAAGSISFSGISGCNASNIEGKTVITIPSSKISANSTISFSCSNLKILSVQMRYSGNRTTKGRLWLPKKGKVKLKICPISGNSLPISASEDDRTAEWTESAYLINACKCVNGVIYMINSANGQISKFDLSTRVFSKLASPGDPAEGNK